MKQVKTTQGRAYVVTAVTVPCRISSNGIELASVEAVGQVSFVAIAEEIDVDQDDAIVTPVFNRASIGKSGGGGEAMRDVIIPMMPDDGVVLSIGVNLIVTTPINNLYIKSVGERSGESRLFFTVESGGVLNVIAPVDLKWLNGNKTHYVNAGDSVAVSVCNNLVTVGSYS